MKRHALMALSVFALGSCGGETTPPEASAPETSAPEAPVDQATPAATETLNPDGWGPLKIGMTKDEVVAAVGETRDPDAAGIPGSDCIEFQPQRAPDGLWVMIEAGKLTRITIGDMSAVKTDIGLGLGDTADLVMASNAYVKRTPHKYQDAPAEYLTLWSTPQSEAYVQDEAARGIVFEIDGTGKVGAIHVGGPSIQYVEGCA